MNVPLYGPGRFAEQNFAAKRARVGPQGPSGSNLAAVYATPIAVTRHVVPIDGNKFVHDIPMEALVMYAPVQSGKIKYATRGSKHLVSLPVCNYLLHEWWNAVLAANDDAPRDVSKLKKLLELMPEEDVPDDVRDPEFMQQTLERLEKKWRVGGVNQTPPGHEAVAPGADRAMVGWMRGFSKMINYWGNVRGDQYLFLLLSFVSVKRQTTYKTDAEGDSAVRILQNNNGEYVPRFLPYICDDCVVSERVLRNSFEADERMITHPDVRSIPIKVGIVFHNATYVATDSSQAVTETIDGTDARFANRGAKLDVHILCGMR